MPAKPAPEHPIAESKRRRGRPRLPNALTPAQRAKRYRDNKRARLISDAASAPPKPAASDRGNTDLTAENTRLQQALDAARVRIADLTGALEFFVNARAKGRKITPDQMKGLHTLLALADPSVKGTLRQKNRR